MPASKPTCAYIKYSYGYVSGCGKRAAYNKYWKWCPYCGKPLINLSRETSDKESKWNLDKEEKRKHG